MHRSADAKSRLLHLATEHACFDHPLFAALSTQKYSVEQLGKLLRNYDAHACVLRRLLLLAGTLMPEPAVGFVLENVRNEYGNGSYADNHQGQLRDVAFRAGVTPELWDSFAVEPGVKRFIHQAPRFYYPPRFQDDAIAFANQPAIKAPPAAIAAGAITATEILAICEFRAMQKAFAHFGLQNHIWFNHVTIEAEHSDESLMLALYFIEERDAFDAVEIGMRGILNANLDLYDGLLSALA